MRRLILFSLLFSSLAVAMAARAAGPQPQTPAPKNPPAAEPAKPSSGPASTANEPLPQIPPDPDKATIYVYRPKRYEAAALQPSVYFDDSELARMTNGRVFVVRIAAGHHTIRSNDKMSGVETEFKPGQDYFVRIDIIAGAWSSHGQITLVQPEQGQFEIKQVKLLDYDHVKNKELVYLPDASTAKHK